MDNKIPTKGAIIMSCARNVKTKANYHARYLNLFVTGKCSPDLLAHELFPNAKEITESYAMFEATHHLPEGYEWNREGVAVVVVGDGHKPRTAAMFCHRTAWEALSVDPALAPRSYPFKRFTMNRNKVEDIKVEWGGPVVIVLPHSHAKIADCLRNITGTKRAVITMDCCVQNIIPGRAPDIEYEDPDVWSPKNIVRVWRDV